MNPPIISFTGDFDFLSNMYPCEVVNDLGERFPSVENAYQAAKAPEDREWQEFCKKCSPKESKTESKSIKLREDWERVKIETMFHLVDMKFSQDPLHRKLIQTNDAYIVEGNTWRDNFWGADSTTLVGANVLGQILMLVRDRCRVRESSIRFTDVAVDDFIVVHRGVVINQRPPSQVWLLCRVSSVVKHVIVLHHLESDTFYTVLKHHLEDAFERFLAYEALVFDDINEFNVNKINTLIIKHL